jgi:hypothetical protein
VQNYLIDQAYVIPIFEEPQAFAGATWVRRWASRPWADPASTAPGWPSAEAEARMPRRYLLGRIAQAALVLWAAFTASFILLQLLPGDAVLIKFLNPELGLGPQEIADIRAAYGADQPVWQQYLHTWGSFSRAISATRCRPACP